MMPYRTDAPWLLLSCLATSACMLGPPRPNTVELLSRPRTESARELVTRSEIAGARARTAYDLLARIRPEFLKSVGASSYGPAPEPTVYIDGLATGGLSVLSEILVGSIAEIRFVRPREAALQRGASHRGGDIMVYTRR